MTPIEYVIANEGLTYTDDPDDPGGPTKYGITLVTLKTVQPDATADTVKALTPDTAAKVYDDVFYTPMLLGALRLVVAQTMLLDCAVLCGQHLSIMTAQHAFGATPLDGVMGMKTISAINGSARFVPCAYEFIAGYQAYLIATTVRHPKLIKFLEGWMTRTRRLYPLIYQGK